MKFTRLMAMLLVSGMAASLSYGQAAPDRNVLTLDGYAGYQFNSTYGNASVSIAREGFDLQDTFSITQRLQVITSVKLEDSVYNFNDFQHESPGVKTPLDQAILFRVYPALLYVINEKWIVTGGALFQDSAQTGALFNDAMTVGGVGMVIYKVSENLTIGGGIVYYTQLEDDSTFLPLASIDWKISDHWRFTGKGTEARITYVVRPELNYYVAALYDTRQYRLEDSAPYHAGVLNDNSVPVRLGLQWTPTEQVTVAGEVGAIAWQELTFDDSEGHRIVKDHVDPTVFIGLQINYRF